MKVAFINAIRTRIMIYLRSGTKVQIDYIMFAEQDAIE